MKLKFKKLNFTYLLGKLNSNIPRNAWCQIFTEIDDDNTDPNIAMRNLIAIFKMFSVAYEDKVLVLMFDEMEQLGWIGSHRPKMISVQSEGCAPIIRAFEQGKDTADFFENPETSALGLRVPAAIGDFLILKAIRESNGYALTVSDKELMDNVKMIGKHEGIFSAPEGGATVATLPKLLDLGVINSKDRIVLFITGSGLKYVDLF